METIKEVPGYRLKFEVRGDSGYDQTISDGIVLREMFDENVYDVHDIETEKKIVVDIGANIGAFTLLALTKGAKRVIAYEPEPHNAELFKKNMELNYEQFSGVEVDIHEIAVTDKSGQKVNIFDGQGGSFVNDVKPISDELLKLKPESNEEVSTISLDDALAPYKEIGILKVDTEGSEYKIIAGASPETLKKISRIVMEYHSTDEVTFGKMLAKLSLYFNLKVFGDYLNNGGQIDARRY